MDNKELITLFRLSEDERRNMLRGSLAELFCGRQVAYGRAHLLVLGDDGTVTAYGDNSAGQCGVEDWEDITQVAAGEFFSVGLRSDGTVAAVGDNTYGQLNVDDWESITDIAVVNCMTIGFMSDGSFVVTSRGADAQDENDDEAGCEPTSEPKNAPAQGAAEEYGGLFSSNTLPDGTLELASFNGRGTDFIRVPELVGGRTVSRIGDRAFYNKWVKKVVLPWSIETIGREAFKYCTYLESIDMPDSISLIHAGAFFECKALREAVIPSSVKRIPADCFYGCENLELVRIPDSIKSIGKGAFCQCPKLVSVVLPPSLLHLGNNSYAFDPVTKVYSTGDKLKE